MDELEEMRVQLTQLKEQLNNQEIVSDKLLRSVTWQKVNRLNRNVWQEGLAVLFVITFGNYSFYKLGTSWWFMGATTLMMITCFLATFIPHNWIKKADVFSGDLLTVAGQVRKLRKFYKDWVKYGTCMIIPWAIWLAFEIYKASDDSIIAFSTIIGMLIGGTVGGFIGYARNKKFVSEMDDIINQITNGIDITPEDKKEHALKRSNDRVIAGVCAGFAEYLNISASTFRICFVLLTILYLMMPGIFAYLICWIVMPKKEK